MPLTYGQAKKYVSQWAGVGGKCPEDDEVSMFLRQVLQHLLYSGQNGNLKKFTFQAVKGIFTLPFELEVPLKIKIDKQVGTVWNKWFDFHSSAGTWDDRDCIPANAFYEDPNEYSTVYELPAGGAHIASMGTCKEADNAHLIIFGMDTEGRDVYSVHNGERIKGEYLSVIDGKLKHTTTKFSKIVSIKKSITVGYVPLFWYRPDTQESGFLSEYTPYEEQPSYRRYRITSPGCGDMVRISVLGRIRLKDHYSDSERIPFDNLYALQLAAQSMNSNFNTDLNTTQAREGLLQEIINRENEYKRGQTGSPIEMFRPLSMGSVKNIVR